MGEAESTTRVSPVRGAVQALPMSPAFLVNRAKLVQTAVRAGRDLARITSALMENVDRARAEGRTIDPVVRLRARALLRRLPLRRTRSAERKKSAATARKETAARRRSISTKRTNRRAG